MEYKITKKECEARIKGVCEGCGGELSAIETVDNSGAPTYWVGCEQCSCFRSGVDRKYWEIARKLIDAERMLPYEHLHKSEYEGTPNRLNYWLSAQCAGLSHEIAYIHNLIKSTFGE